MSKLDTLVDNKIVQNLFIWLVIFVILLGTIQAENRWLTSIFAIALLAPPVYVNNILILPLLRKKVFKFLFLFFVNVLFFTSVLVYIISITSDQELKWKMWVNFLGVMVLALTFASAIKLASDSFYRKQQVKDAELKLLKAQLNPHFLFNTLNNLYGLSVVKSDKLPGLMLKLSDLLRYSLYDTKETLVPIEKEIQYLENYVSLEKIRLENSTEILFHKNGDFFGKKVAPMLFIVFVENAFKHLDVAKYEKSKVLIDLVINEEELKFKCSNTFTKNDLALNAKTNESGIGLENAKKRLDLMYPDKHRLQIEENENTFVVELTLQF